MAPSLTAMGLLDLESDAIAWYWIRRFNEIVKRHRTPPKRIWAQSRKDDAWGWETHPPSKEDRLRTAQLWNAFYDWTLREDPRFWEALVGYGAYFEWHVASLFEELGWNVSLTRGSYDEGIDILLEETEGAQPIELAVNYMLMEGPVAIQCKATGRPASRAILNQLQGVGFHKMLRWAVLVSASGVTRDAYKYLRLIEGNGLNYLSSSELSRAAKLLRGKHSAKSSAV